MRLAAVRTLPYTRRFLLLASRWTPKMERVLVIESGSRAAAAKFLMELYGDPDVERVDMLTCYETIPLEFDERRGEALFTQAAGSNQRRQELLQQLAGRGYTAVCILCTGDPIMTKWKWAAALRIPAKVMIVNESADTFWLDRGHLKNLRAMWWNRRDPWRGGAAARSLVADLLLFPFTAAVLVAFAASMQVRRLTRRA